MGQLGRGDGACEPLEAEPVDDVLPDLLMADLDNSWFGFFLCQPGTLRLHWMNRRGRALLDAGRQLTATGGGVSAADRRWQPALDDLARRPGTTAIVIPALDDCEALVLRARCLGEAQSTAEAFLGLVAYTLSQTAQFILPDLSSVYDLTPAEMRVLRLLAGGRTATGLAMDLGVTIETARTHIRRIYAKMNVSSREQLICLANRYRVP